MARLSSPAIIMLLAILFSQIISAADHKSGRIQLNKIHSEIRLDGEIDSVWSLADSADNFIQQEPFYGENSSEKTVAKILTTDEAIYCLIIAHDKSGKVQDYGGSFDTQSGDLAILNLDTYNDKRTGYKFLVSASGIRSDGRLLDDGRNIDYSWDGIWFAATKANDSGFVAEIKIPYKSISYDRNLTEWGIDFERWIPHLAENTFWMKYEQNEGLRVSKFGKLELNGFKPGSEGKHLEIYPVGLSNLMMQKNGKYKINSDAGIDLFYNPSPEMTYMLTANPDFAQIEADPYAFNITRYETYFSEKRPFFTQGNEIFAASGSERNKGFYKPLELFYSRRIGKMLPDGSEIPLITGTKAYGRLEGFEYGGLLALSGEKKYFMEGNENSVLEERAYFGAASLKKQIFGNSTIGTMFAGKRTRSSFDGVIDIDGAIRGSYWQFAYQAARSFKNNNSGDAAASSGLIVRHKDFILLSRFRYIGNQFDINEIGYVPWKGTWENTTFAGPRWYFEQGPLREMTVFGGYSLNYEKADLYTDYSGALGLIMKFRDNWGGEIDFYSGESKDNNQKYNASQIFLSLYIYTYPDWNFNFLGSFSKTYNFVRGYSGNYIWGQGSLEWTATKALTFYAAGSIYIEEKPDGSLEDLTFNSRPAILFTPVNDINFRLYVDNLYHSSSNRLEKVAVGFLFSYNFLPKSWIYFAYNETQDRKDIFDEFGNRSSSRMVVSDRGSVFKVKYLYYF